jgi:SAM-dependent methyltransferase
VTASAYDLIGQGYARHRRPDPRIAAAVHAALGDARTVVDVGAGTGSYEPSDRDVVAVEPSAVMLAQRPAGAAPAVQAVAEALPFASRSFDAALAVLTVHHWPERAAGYAELRRVARRAVVLTIDPELHSRMWLVDYIPEMAEVFRRIPPVDEVVDGIGARLADVVTVPLPGDCTDQMTVGNWRRPERYLDPEVRACGSAFHEVGPAAVERGMAALEDELRTGRWPARYGALLDLDELDVGLRLVVS